MEQELEKKELVKPDNIIKKNRRYIVWIAFISIMAVQTLALFGLSVEHVVKYENIISWYYTIMGGIVMSYIRAKGIENFKAISVNGKN